MNHIGAKTEAAQTAWDQLAQTQNYEHPIRQQQSQTISSPTSAPKLPIAAVNNQTQPPVGQIQQQPPTTPQPQQPEYGDELHPELVRQGWKKFWSKRENRPYYWNKITNESLWETPVLNRQFDPLTDPLGICSTTSPSGPNSPHSPLPGPSRPPYKPPLKRNLSHPHQASVPMKKFVLAGPWDLEVQSSVYIYNRPPSHLLHPHPEIEYMRGVAAQKLFQTFENLCQQRESIKAPKGSFNRWLMERKVIDKGLDPILPSSCLPEVSPSMYREILQDIPIRIVKPKYTSDARKQLSRYAEAAVHIIENRLAPAESKKIVKWNAEETFEWLRRTVGASYEDFQDRLEHLRRQCEPHLVETVKSSVEALCSKIYHLSVEHVKKIRERHVQLLKDNGLHDPTPPLPPSLRKEEICSPIQFALPPIRLPVVDYQFERDHINVKYTHPSSQQPDTHTINMTHLQKLEQLYRYNCDDNFSLFIPRLYCMLKRYSTFLGNYTPVQQESEMTQAAIPASVFNCLNVHFGVTFECFASPLNCYFRQYCSAFGDTDSYFGSRGPFLDFYPTKGSFQANPPFCEELIDATLQHIDRLLSDSNYPLSFIVFLPEFKDKPLKCMSRIEDSAYKRKLLVVPAMEHEYRHGYQHVLQKTEVNVKSTNSTLVCWLQNEQGYQLYKPTDTAIDAFLESYRPGKDKNIEATVAESTVTTTSSITETNNKS
ncbi:mRNA (2'-O-methyladenosine-N(6)-)-methyltransferase [Chironomus tepperi]|uniref:mRNA (2'-O-methyladenosine-N(6)-)-methyltransferase n=1 Tax=Chironomus tepperi TaxID=113505 RepID=UPI00391F4E31